MDERHAALTSVKIGRQTKYHGWRIRANGACVVEVVSVQHAVPLIFVLKNTPTRLTFLYHGPTNDNPVNCCGKSSNDREITIILRLI